MKNFLAAFIFLASTLSGATITTRDGTIYKRAEVTQVEPDGIRLIHDSGVAKLTYEEMPDSLRAKYHFDPAKVQAYRSAILTAKRAVEEKASAVEAARAQAKQDRQDQIVKEQVAQRQAAEAQQNVRVAEDQEIANKNWWKDNTPLLLCILIQFIFACFGAYIGSRRGKAFAGFFWGLLFNWIGWIIIALQTRKRCPRCQSVVQEKALICPACQGGLNG